MPAHLYAFQIKWTCHETGELKDSLRLAYKDSASRDEAAGAARRTIEAGPDQLEAVIYFKYLPGERQLIKERSITRERTPIESPVASQERDEKPTKKPSRPWIPQVITAVILVFTFEADSDDDIHILVGFASCGTFSYLLWRELLGRKRAPLVWAFAGLALLYNPIIRVPLEDETWAIIRLLSAVFLGLTTPWVARAGRWCKRNWGVSVALVLALSLGVLLIDYSAHLKHQKELVDFAERIGHPPPPWSDADARELERSMIRDRWTRSGASVER